MNAWTDEWAERDTVMHDWDFGMLDREREPKPALDVLASHYARMHYSARKHWPMVSVACCAYNAAATIGETPESLPRLTYPNVEVIVVDVGSRDASSEIGRFDPVYRAAGDGVDVCWKLLERGETIAFLPAALVWHHRRQTTAGHLRQQRGYGEAEATLEARNPERYGLFGGTY